LTGLFERTNPDIFLPVMDSPSKVITSAFQAYGKKPVKAVNMRLKNLYTSSLHLAFREYVKR